MNSPYWLVLINLLTSFFVLLGLFIYRFVYPKKKIAPITLLIIFSLLPLVSIFRQGVYQSGDFTTHVMEEMSFYNLLQHSELFPKWAGDMNATYGYPAFLFTYPLPFYLMAIIHFVGFSFINSTKILLSISYYFSGLFMYFLLKKIVKKIAAVGGALCYIFAPYHLIDLHFRADVGETLSFVFLPIALLAAWNFIDTRKWKWFILEVFSFAFLLLSHPAISLSGFIVLPLYIFVLILNQKKNHSKEIMLQIFTLLVSIVLTAFYWIPLISDLRFTLTSKYIHTVTYLQPLSLLYSPYRIGFLYQGPQGQLALFIGYIQILLIIYSLLILFLKKPISRNKKYLLILSQIVILIGIFMMLPYSKPVWTVFPILISFQYAYRILGILLFAISVLTAIILDMIKRKWLIVFIFLLMVFPTLLNWGNRKMLPEINDSVLKQEIPNIAFVGSPLAQAITVWSDPMHAWAKSIPAKHMEILKGMGTITELQRNNIQHQYLVNAKTQLYVRENTLYFPGWTLYIDNNSKAISILTATTPKGIIGFTIPKGKHIVSVLFKDTFAVTLGKIISGVSSGILLIIFLYMIFLKKFRVTKSHSNSP